MHSVSVIIPAYNEEHAIAHALRETRAVFVELGGAFEIIVVDDGSKDGTRTVLADMQKEIPELVVIHHEKNQGKGAAVKTGIAAAKNDWMLMVDADLSTHPNAFKQFMASLDTSDIVIGSRRIQGANITVEQPLYRRFAGNVFRWMVKMLLHLPYEDTQCGFKAFHKKTRPMFSTLEAKGWAFDVELLAKAAKQGLRIKEVPVEWHHGRESKVRLSDAMNIFKELFRIRKSVAK